MTALAHARHDARSHDASQLLDDVPVPAQIEWCVEAAPPVSFCHKSSTSGGRIHGPVHLRHRRSCSAVRKRRSQMGRP